MHEKRLFGFAAAFGVRTRPRRFNTSRTTPLIATP